MKFLKRALWLAILVCMALPGVSEETTGINLEGYDYPYPVHRFEFRSQQQDLVMVYMHERSPQPNGRTVVLLHGKNFNGAYFGETMAALLEAGFDVLVPDQIGFGKSSKPANYHFTFQQLVENTHSLLEKIGLKKGVIVGHSMGGMVATRFALMYPQSTERLVLVNPIGLEDWKLKAPYVGVDAWYQQELDKTAEKIRSYQKKNYYFGEWKPSYDPWVEVLAAPLDSIDYPRIAWNAALTYGMIFTQPVVYEFSQLRVPTTLMLGTKDRTALGKDLVTPEVAATMGRYDQLGPTIVEQIPQGNLITFEGLGHLPHIQDFPRFWAKFLKVLK